MHQILDEVVTFTGATEEGQWVGLLADFTLKLAPGPSNHRSSPFNLYLAAVALLLDPLSKAIQVNHFHTTVTLTGRDEGALLIAIIPPTDFARFFI